VNGWSKVRLFLVCCPGRYDDIAHPAAVTAMNLDDKVCYCFHISQRKLVNFIRREKPRVPSQLSLCGGAGTGCGWCIPFLRQLHQQAVEGGVTELETLSAADYELRRASYVRAGKGKPPAGATPLPAAELPDPAAGGERADGLT
jgi:bacterioferritin-associated ferredoxin